MTPTGEDRKGLPLIVSGTVGGSMLTFEEIGRNSVQLAIRILAGAEAQATARAESYQGGADV
jgi:hypothetical protein